MKRSKGINDFVFFFKHSPSDILPCLLIPILPTNNEVFYVPMLQVKTFVVFEINCNLKIFFIAKKKCSIHRTFVLYYL